MIHGEEAMELIKLLYPEIGEFPDNKFVSIGDVIVSKNSIYHGRHIDIIYRSDDDSFMSRILENSVDLGLMRNGRL